MLVQRNEPFVKISTKGTSCSILTLFAAIKNEEEIPRWTRENNSWKIATKGETTAIQIRDEKIVVSTSNHPEKTIEF